MLRLLSLFLGPIFAKEMVELARRKRYYFNRVLFGLALLFTLFVVWDSYSWRLRQVAGRSKLLAEMAESMFHGLSGVEYGAVFLLVPLFLCGVIAGEREERTLELLFTTQLSDREIVLGKLASRVVVLVLLILCALPVMCLIMLFGGVDPEGVFRVLAATLLAILYAGAHATYFTAITKSPMGALVRTYWWLALWMVGLPVALLIPIAATTPGPTHPVAQAYFAFEMMVNPLAPFITAMDGFVYQQMAGYIGTWFFPATFVLPTAWSGFLIWRAVRRLRQAPKPFSLRLGWLRVWKPRPAVPAGRRTARAEWTWLGLRVRNPLWLRARLTRVYDREGHIGRIQWFGWVVAGVFLVLLLLFERRPSRGPLSQEDTAIAFLAVSWIAVAVLTAIFAGVSLVGDRRRGFFDLVLLTPLEPREILDGTWLAVWQHVRRLFWLPVVLCLLFWATGASHGTGLLISLTTATLFLALLIWYGIACSLAAKTIPGALVPTFVFPLLVNIGLVFLMPIFRTGLGPGLWVLAAIFFLVSRTWVRRSTSAAAVGCYLMAVHIALLSVLTCWTWDGGMNHQEYPVAAMHPAHLTIATLDKQPNYMFRTGMNWPMIYVCYWAGLVINLVWLRHWLIRNFERIVERTGQRDYSRPRALARPAVSSPSQPQPLAQPASVPD